MKNMSSFLAILGVSSLGVLRSRGRGGRAVSSVGIKKSSFEEISFNIIFKFHPNDIGENDPDGRIVDLVYGLAQKLDDSIPQMNEFLPNYIIAIEETSNEDPFWNNTNNI